LENNNTTYQLETMDTFEPEARGLMAMYNTELPLPYPLRPDWQQYRMLEQAGVLMIVTARDQGMLIGFFAMVIHPNINCRDQVVAFGNTLYLHPAYRGTIGIRLIKLAEQEAQARGAQCFMIASQAAKPINALLERRGYKATETIFARSVE
jgi:GNAT superfamily N-acetyltransferase